MKTEQLMRWWAGMSFKIRGSRWSLSITSQIFKAILSNYKLLDPNPSISLSNTHLAKYCWGSRVLGLRSPLCRNLTMLVRVRGWGGWTIVIMSLIIYRATLTWIWWLMNSLRRAVDSLGQSGRKSNRTGFHILVATQSMLGNLNQQETL